MSFYDEGIGVPKVGGAAIRPERTVTAATQDVRLRLLLPFVTGLADSRNRTIATDRVSPKLPVARA